MMKIKHLAVLTLGIFLTLTTNTSAQTPKKVIISSFKMEPTLQILKPIMKEAYARLGIEMVIQLYPIERAVQLANEGQTDGELHRKGGLSNTYPNLIQIPVKLITADISVFTKGKQLHLPDWESLRPYRIGYQRGVKILELNQPDTIKAEVMGNMKQNLLKLDSNRLDVAILPTIETRIAINKLKLSNIIEIKPPFYSVPLYHYLNIKNKDLVDPLTKVLKEMQTEGTIHNIEEEVIRSLQEM